MQNELINKAAELFPTLGHWKSFRELHFKLEAIQEFWLTEATNKIRNHFLNNLPSDWSFEPFGASFRDTRWFLREFGADSIVVAYGYWYRLDLAVHNKERFKAELVTKLLKEKPDYLPIYRAFEQIDYQFIWGQELIDDRNFKFKSETVKLTEEELIWYVGQHMDEFVGLAISKIERFTNNTDVTAAIRNLNQSTLN